MNWLRRFMMGRYGVDQLSFAMMLAAMVLMMFTRGRLWPLALLGAAMLLVGYWRMLSRNISARAQENGRFLGLCYKVRNWANGLSRQLQDKSHRYYSCPNCRQKLRVPRGRGKIAITCPRCGREFVKRT